MLNLRTTPLDHQAHPCAPLPQSHLAFSLLLYFGTFINDLLLSLGNDNYLGRVTMFGCSWFIIAENIWVKVNLNCSKGNVYAPHLEVESKESRSSMKLKRTKNDIVFKDFLLWLLYVMISFLFFFYKLI